LRPSVERAADIISAENSFSDGSKSKRKRQVRAIAVNAFLAALFASAFVFIQLSISGTRLAFSLPAYLLIGLAGVLGLFARRREDSRASRVCLAVTAIFFSYILARTFSSPVEYLARPDRYMVLACLVTYGLFAVGATDRLSRVGVVTVMLALAVPEVLAGAYQFGTDDRWLPFHLVHSPSNNRARGSFISSIHFAGLLEALAPFALAFAFWGARRVWVRLLAFLIAALCYLGVVISISRGGWLSSLVSLPIFLALSLVALWRAKRERFWLIASLSALALIAAPIGAYVAMNQSAPLRKRVELLAKLNTAEQAVYDIRIYNWQAAMDQWRLAPWLGTGAGTHLYYGREFRRPQLQADPEHAHSDYLELLAEYGVAGVAGMALFLLCHLVHGVRGFARLTALRRANPYQSSPELALNFGALTAVSAYLAHSVVDFNLHLPGNALLYAFIFALLAHPAPPPVETSEDDEETVRRPLRLPTRLALPALGGWLVLVALRHLPGEYLTSRARIAVRDGDYPAAVTYAQRALAWQKDDPFLYLHLGQALRHQASSLPPVKRREMLTEAVAAYRAGLTLFPRDEILLVRLALALEGLGDYQGARASYQAALQLDPNLGILYAYYGRFLHLVGREEEGRKAMEKAQSLTSIDIYATFGKTTSDSEALEAPPK
jgi:O-antigen ligase